MSNNANDRREIQSRDGYIYSYVTLSAIIVIATIVFGAYWLSLIFLAAIGQGVMQLRWNRSRSRLG